MVAGYKTYVQYSGRWFIICCYIAFPLLRVSSYHQEMGGNPDLSECHLATPGLMYFMNQVDVWVTVNSSLLKDGEKAWVGYALKPVYLQYVGCVHIEDIRNKIPYDETPAAADLGICHRICYNSEKPFLGMLGSGLRPCKCFDEEIEQFNMTTSGCTKRCRNGKFICGGYSSVAIYKEIDSVNASVAYDGDDKCLSIYESEYNWEYCNMLYRPACTTGKDGQRAKKDWRSKLWDRSIRQCFERGWYPMGYNEDVRVGTQTYWTGVVQTKSLIQLSEWPPVSSDLVLGYAERVGDKHILKFTSQRNSINQSICHEVKSDISTDLPTNTSDNSGLSLWTTQSGISKMPSLHDNHTDVNTSSHQEVQFTTVIGPVTTLKGSNESNVYQRPPVQQRNPVLLYVLVPIVILVLVGLLVTALILLRIKRRDRNKGQIQAHSQKLLDDGLVTFNRQECVSITDENNPSEIERDDNGAKSEGNVGE